jgi:hypothetical protein
MRRSPGLGGPRPDHADMAVLMTAASPATATPPSATAVRSRTVRGSTRTSGQRPFDGRPAILQTAMKERNP